MKQDFLPREAFADEQSYITYKQHMATLREIERANVKKVWRKRSLAKVVQGECREIGCSCNTEQSDWCWFGKPADVERLAAQHTRVTGHETFVHVVVETYVYFTLEDEPPPDTPKQSA